MSEYNLGTARGQIVIDGDQAAAGFRVAQAAAQGFFDSVKDRVADVQDLGVKMRNTGAAGVAGFGLAIKVASAFEAQMSAVKAVSGANEKQFESLRQKALQLGKDTAFSASEAGQAMEELVKAGIPIEGVLNGAADATVALAAAGGVTLPRAAEIAANAMNQFSLNAQDMPKIADLIAGAANASAIDVGEFGVSLQQVGAVAALTGFKFEDVAVAIAELGNAGIKGSDAGTSLKTMLMNLIPVTDRQINKMEELGLLTYSSATALQKLSKEGIKPVSNSLKDVTKATGKHIELTKGYKLGTEKNTKATQDFLRELGVTQNAFFDTTGKVKPMVEIQGILAKATKDMTEQQKLATFELLFGQDAIRAAAILSKNGAEGYTKLAGAMNKIKAADVAKVRLDNLKGSVEQFKGSWETAMITVGSVFLPLVQKLVNGITAIVNVFNNLPSSVQTGVAVIGGVGSVLLLGIGLFLQFIPIIGLFIAKFLGMRVVSAVFKSLKVGFTALRAGAGVMGALSSAAGVMGGALTRWGKIARVVWNMAKLLRFAWVALTGPVGLIVAAIAALIAITVVLYKKFEAVRNVLDPIGRWFKDVFVAALNAVKSAWQEFVVGLQGGASGASSALTPFMNAGRAMHDLWVNQIVPGLRALAAAFQENVMPALKEAGGAIMATLMSAWKTLSDTWTGTVMPALRSLADVFMNQLLPALKSLWAAVWPIIKVLGIVVAVIVGSVIVASFKLAMIFIKYVLPVLIKVGAFIVTVLIKALTFIAKILMATVIPAIIWFAKLLISAVTAAINDVVGVIDWLVMAFKKIGEWIGNVIGWFKDLWDGLSSGGSSAASSVGGVIDSIKGFFQGIADWFMSTIAPIFKGIWDFLVNGAKAAWGVLQPIIHLISTIFEIVFLAIQLVVKTAMDLIKQYILTPMAAIGTWILAKLTAIKNFFVNAWTALSVMTYRAWTAIVGAVMKVLGPIIAWVAARIATMKANVAAGWALIKSATSTAWNAVVNFIKRIFGPIISWISGRINAARNALSAGWNAIKNATSAAWNRIVTSVRDAIAKVVSFAKGIAGKVTSAIGSLGKKLWNLGRDLIGGLIGGIQEKFRDLMKIAQGMADKIKNTLKHALESKSPSKVTWRIGNDVGNGLIGGMVESMKHVARTARKLGAEIGSNMPTSVTASMAPTVGSLGATVHPFPRGGGDQPPSVLVDVDVQAHTNADAEEIGRQTGKKIGYAFSTGAISPTIPGRKAS